VKRFVVLAGMVAALLAAAACGGSTQGQGTSTTTGTVTSDTGSSEATTSSGSGNSALPSDACSLMTPSEALQLHATGTGEASLIAGAPACQWSFGTTAVTVTVDAHLGVSQLNVTGPETNLTIGNHHAVQMEDTSDTAHCFISFEVTSSSRVDIQVVEAQSTPTATTCQGAMKIATVVEKHLPSS